MLSNFCRGANATALMCVVLVTAQIHRDVASAQTSPPASQAPGSAAPLVCETTAPSSSAQGAKIVCPQATSLMQPDFRSVSAPNGTANVLVTVGSSGFANAVALLESTGIAELDRASLLAAVQNRWRAGTLDGTAVPMNVEVTYSYDGTQVLVGIKNPENSAVSTLGNPALTVIPAQLRETRQPDYPEEAKRQNAKGAVTVFVTVTSTGEIHDGQVAVSSGNARLDFSALLAALGSRYIPVKVNGKVFTQTYKVEYSFPPH